MVTVPASGFVKFRGPDFNFFIIITGGFPVDHALGTAGRLAALHADGLKFINDLGCCHQCRDGAEGFTPEILIQSRHHYSFALIGQLLADIDNLVAKKLDFIDSNYLSFGFQVNKKLLRVVDRQGFQSQAVVRADFHFLVTLVQSGFKNLNILPGDLRPFDPADQFLAFSAEHSSGNHFQASTVFIQEFFSPFGDF